MDKMWKIVTSNSFGKGFAISSNIYRKPLNKPKLLEVRVLLHQKSPSLKYAFTRSLHSASSDIIFHRCVSTNCGSNYKKYKKNSGSDLPPYSKSSLALITIGFISACCASYDSGKM